MNKFIIFAALIAVAAAAGAPYPPPPAYPKAAEPGMPYDFEWAVKDAPSYNDFGQQESSDGKVVKGSYRVVLPDGRTQTVDYKVEGDSGFVADVQYKGEAKYPEPKKY